MSNDAVLINIQTNDLSFMEDGGRPEEYTEVATGAYRFPVPWFFCFDTDDFSPIQYKYKAFSGEEMSESMTTVCAEVEKARENLKNGLGLMQTLCGSDEVALDYWKVAVDGLLDLPHPFIFIDPLDIFLGAEWNDERFKSCFSRSEESIPIIKEYAGYPEDSRPYSFQEFCRASPDKLTDRDRVDCSAAMDFGGHRFTVSRASKEQKEKVANRKPVKKSRWKFWKK